MFRITRSDPGFQASTRVAVARVHGLLEECVIVRINFIHDERGLIPLLKCIHIRTIIWLLRELNR